MKKKLIGMILAAGAMLGAWAANVRVYVNVVPEAGWNPDRYFYAWSGTAQNFGAWPGIKVENAEVLNGETWHYMDIDATDDEFYLIFNDGESHCQTIIVLIAPVKEGKRFFVRVSSEGEANAFSGRTSNYATIEYEKVQLWEGGPYWATMNIGAEIPEDYGYYFWWGDTIGYKRENDKWVASDGSSSDFSFESGNTPTYNKDVATLQSEGWITAGGVLHPTNDAAHVQWGDGWRMPTVQDLNDLVNKCDWTWTTQNGVNGYIVRGRGDYASNSIFLPCCGWGDETWFDGSGLGAYYWSSVPGSDRYNAYELYFRSDHHDTYCGDYRRFGSSVRPVQDAPTTVGSWTSGDCTVTLDTETGTLTVSGPGAMADEDLPPWKEKSDDIKKIVIEDGVTAIGSLAFSDFREATSVQIGKDVVGIGGGGIL